jgi:ribosomal-protein-alanine N-acetyltransferase
MCGFGDLNAWHARGVLVYALNRNHWGKGYATEAVGAAITFGFTSLGLERIEALVMLDNPASAHVLEKVGMRYEGVLRSYMRIRGAFYDLRMYSILRAERFAIGETKDEGRKTT